MYAFVKFNASQRQEDSFELDVLSNKIPSHFATSQRHF